VRAAFPEGREVFAFGIAILIAGASLRCATTATSPLPTLTWEQHTLRIPLTVEAKGTVSFAERPPLLGRLDLTPILEAEGVKPGKPALTAQAMMHYGRLYIVADRFRSIWEVTPQPGTAQASYRPIHVLPDTAPARLKDVRLSRYGSSQSSCLRLDHAEGPPVFITSAGEARHDCP
jgi:hypothetical protein